MTGTATILRADARALPLPDASVDLIVTSPPYYALRDYRDGDASLNGQIGAEATPAQYIAALVECTREWMRVLKPSGSIFVNLGDKYGRPGGGADVNPRSLAGAGKGTTQRTRTASDGGGREKCLMLLPERYRIAAVDELGLIARAVVIWDKPNGLPESVTDRVRRSHEDWVHLTKETRYFSAVDEIREPSDPRNLRPGDLAGVVSAKDQARRGGRNGAVGHVGKPLAFHALGKLPGSVWEIATEPLTVPEHLGVDHFAAFPAEWPRRIILGWSPSGICVECGEGRRPVTSGERRTGSHGPPTIPYDRAGAGTRHGAGRSTLTTVGSYRITGEACACTPYTDHPGTGERHRSSGHVPVSGGNAGRNIEGGDGRPGNLGSGVRVGPLREYHFDRWESAPAVPSVVLDPFGGTGTVALVAKALGRYGVSVDRSADYCRLAEWRTTDPGQLAKAMRVAAPPKQLDGQVSLFDEMEATA